MNAKSTDDAARGPLPQRGSTPAWVAPITSRKKTKEPRMSEWVANCLFVAGALFLMALFYFLVTAAEKTTDHDSSNFQRVYEARKHGLKKQVNPW